MFKKILSKSYLESRLRLRKIVSKEEETMHASYSNVSNGSRSNDVGTTKAWNSTITSLLSNSVSDLEQNHTNKVQPGFREVPDSKKQNSFIKKLPLCCFVFDFTDPTTNLKEEELKRQTLLELVDYVNSANGKFPETVMQEAIKMVSANLFRAFTPQPRENKAMDGLYGKGGALNGSCMVTLAN